MQRKSYAIITAAGHGTRMGGPTPKQFLELGEKPILRMTIEKFLSALPEVRIITVLPSDCISLWKSYCAQKNFSCPQIIVAGGITRYHSVKNALSRVPDGAIVAIHDGVRPLLSESLITKMFTHISTDENCHGLIPVLPSVDTLRILHSEDGVLKLSEGRTIDRSEVFAVQTPQFFRSEDIKRAYGEQPFSTALTDDASVAALSKIPLSFCEGERFNVKITTPEDLLFAEVIIEAKNLYPSPLRRQ